MTSRRMLLLHARAAAWSCATLRNPPLAQTPPPPRHRKNPDRPRSASLCACQTTRPPTQPPAPPNPLLHYHYRRPRRRSLIPLSSSTSAEKSWYFGAL
ncbi:hypothetical protein DFJ73DRAFT_843943, partial [Zopfochytrium polystomum]